MLSKCVYVPVDAWRILKDVSLEVILRSSLPLKFVKFHKKRFFIHESPFEDHI